MQYLISTIFFWSTVLQVIKPSVGPIPIKVTNLKPVRSSTKECRGYKLMH